MKIIGTDPVDGNTAESYLPEEYSGTCALKYKGGCFDDSETYWYLFPSVEDGCTAARMAIRNDIGGYSHVEIHLPNAAPEDTQMLDSADSWLLLD